MDPDAPTDEFARIAAASDSPMFIVTTCHDGDRAGCLVGFGCQVSIAPARFLVCLSVKNRTYRLARHASRLAVHLLGSDQDRLARLFGSYTGDEIDKFRGCAWKPDVHGVPILDGVPAWFAGPITAATEFGDHTGFVITPDSATGAERIAPLLTMHSALGIDPGHPA
ncbi:flavin reductase family protein [Tomitella cavernea]|uniref:Flavin reductase family protein n=1 Tax=Tomitella cavernea TaxID=1387982 RepID=A0ABP9CSR8_9ACTN|nr:flavin reductase family protein [Tomitella cavernea]